MTGSVLLVLSTDALAAALLGAAVELSGYSPEFPRDAESARDALRRVRPAIVFIDCDDEAAADAFIGPAMMMRAAIAIYGTPRSKRNYRTIANSFGVECFELPIEHQELAKVLDACARIYEP